MCDSSVGRERLVGHQDALVRRFDDGSAGFSPVQRSFLKASLSKMSAGIHVNHGICNLCGACLEVCLEGFFMIRGDNIYVRREKDFNCCPGNWVCGACVNACPVGAITIAKPEEHLISKT